MDSLHSTRPIEYEVVSPDDADGMFDALTYVKGGAFCACSSSTSAPSVFRDGIRRYLAHSYANTVTNDLWAALEEASGQPVARSWTPGSSRADSRSSACETATEPVPLRGAGHRGDRTLEHRTRLEGPDPLATPQGRPRRPSSWLGGRAARPRAGPRRQRRRHGFFRTAYGDAELARPVHT